MLFLPQSREISSRPDGYKSNKVLYTQNGRLVRADFLTINHYISHGNKPNCLEESLYVMSGRLETTILLDRSPPPTLL